jgi:ABC-2 type transport system ATP-binding protein
MRGLDGEELDSAVRDAVDRCAIGDVLGKDIGELSKGYRRRVALAQSLLHSPECLILDEPTEGLDPNQIIEIRELIKEIGREKTILLSSHILPEVEATCSRVLIINQGRIVADGTSESLQAGERAESRLQVKLDLGGNGSAPSRDAVKSKLAALPHVRTVKDSEDEGERIVGFEVRADSGGDPRRDIFQLAVKEGWLLLEMRREVVSLEHVFRRLTAS